MTLTTTPNCNCSPNREYVDGTLGEWAVYAKKDKNGEIVYFPLDEADSL